jgi:alpha-1,4-digalacturonate transport system permease protein
MATSSTARQYRGGRVDAATVGAYGCLVLGTAVMFLPVLWIVLSSFKDLNEIYRIPPTFLPEHWITSNYSGALERFPFLRYLTNSVVVTVVATALTLAINSMAAFALSKYRFPGRDAIVLVILGTLMIPLQVIMLPVYLVIAKLGMANSLLGIIIPPSATPTGVFLLRQYMLTIPDDLLDAARMDNASEWRVYWRIVLPLTAPALAVLAIFSVVWRWNDFLWPLIVLSRKELYTLQVGLNTYAGELNVQWHYILAMTVVTMIPVVLVFVFLQRFITTGIATAGIK